VTQRMNMEGNVRIGLDAVGQHFESLEDPRSEINLRHPLVSVVVIALMAVLAGADGPTAIAKWAQLKSNLLLKQLHLPNGVIDMVALPWHVRANARRLMAGARRG